MTTALTEIAEQELFLVSELREKELARLDLVAQKGKSLLDIEIVDKASYKLVHDGQIELRDNRTRITKGRLLFTESLTKQTKDAIKCEKDLIKQMSIDPTAENPVYIEDLLKAKKEAYDTEQERIKKEKEEAEQKILQNRIDELTKYGAVLDIGVLKTMSDDGFRMMADQWKGKWEEREAIRIQEEQAQQKKRQEESEAIQKQKEENDRVAAENQRIADENARKAKDIQDKENETKRQEELKTMAESARLKGIEDEKARVESERVAKEAKEKADREQLEKEGVIEKWKKENGVTEENKNEYDVRVEFTSEGRIFTLWRKISVFSN